MAAKKKNHDDEPKAEAAPTAVPVHVDNKTRRSDEDAIEGGWVDVVSGDHQGRRGAYEQTLTRDPATGYPATILVRSRDAENEPLVVDYEDARPAVGYQGGR